MNLIRLPIPNEYVYIDADKIISIEFNAHDGRLTLCLLDEVTRVIYSDSRKVLDKILKATNCQDNLTSATKNTSQ